MCVCACFDEGRMDGEMSGKEVSDALGRVSLMAGRRKPNKIQHRRARKMNGRGFFLLLLFYGRHFLSSHIESSRVESIPFLTCDASLGLFPGPISYGVVRRLPHPVERLHDVALRLPPTPLSLL